MGQKINPNIFRLGKTKEWNSKYFEKKKVELPIYTFRYLEIKNFIEKFFRDKKLRLDNFKINFFNNKLNIFVSYSLNRYKKILSIKFKCIKELSYKLISYFFKKYSIKLSVKKFFIIMNIFLIKSYRLKNNVNKKLVNLENKLTTYKFKSTKVINIIKYYHYFLITSFSKKLFLNFLSLKKKFRIIKKSLSFNEIGKKITKTLDKKQLSKFLKLKVLKHYEKHLFAIKNKKTNLNSFLNNFIESLNKFTNKKLEICLVLKQLNKNETFNKKEFKLFKKKLVQLRKYNQKEFFSEGIHILFSFMKSSKSATLLVNFLTKYFKKLKRHNPFLNFVKKTLILLNNNRYYNYNKIKIKLKGRLNGAPRTKSKFILINNLPILTLDTNVDYKKNKSFTSNGTIGVKAWINNN